MKRIFIVILFLPQLVLGQNNRVGINTAAPAATLHVEAGDVLFKGTPNLNTPINPPATGAGTRWMWYPDKSAFRVGTISGTQWDKDSIGYYSFAAGQNVKAIQSNSFAMGSDCRVGGANAFALGLTQNPNGIGSMALGSFSGTIDTALFSLSLGVANYNYGKFTTAIGYSNAPVGNYSSAFGFNNVALGEYGLAMGGQTNATGKYSITLGWVSAATGMNSISGGYGGSASGDYAIKFGEYGQASGYGSFSFGSTTHAAGKYAASGGYTTRANGFASLVVGQFNDTLVTTQTSITPATPLFIVGNGNSTSARSNALVVLKNGYIGVGNVNPQFGLHVLNNNTNDGGWEQGIVIENNAPLNTAGEAAVSFRNAALAPTKQWSAGINQSAAGFSFSYGQNFAGGSTRFYIDTTGEVGIGTITPGFLLEVNGTAGKPGGGTWTASSDARLKQDIRPFTDGLEAILKINPIWYHYNSLSGYDTQPEYVGVIAQELQEVAPYMVTVSEKKMNDGSSGYLQVDNSAMTYMLINAVKEQQAEIDALEKEFDALMTSLSEKAAGKK